MEPTSCRPKQSTTPCANLCRARRCSIRCRNIGRAKDNRSSRPGRRWAAATGGLPFFAYCINYLIDPKYAVIVGVEAATAVRQAEVTAHA